MKTYLLTFLSFYFLCKNSYAQWTELNSGTTNHLISIFFTSKDTGFACGISTFIQTENGGLTWHSNSSINSVGKFFEQIDFVNQDTGFIIADTNFYKSTDGGNQWTEYSIPSAIQHYQCLDFLNGKTGFVAGETGIYETTNGGTSWNLISGLYNCINIKAISVDTLYIVDLAFQAEPTGFYSVNNGSNWTMINYPFFDPDIMNPPYYQMQFVDDSFMVSTTSGFIKSNDVGNNWLNPNDPLTIDLSASAVYFTSPDTGYLYGANDTSVILKTVDSGNSWIQCNLQMDTLKGIHCIYCLDGNNCFACGPFGFIIKTTNGGVYNSTNNFPNPQTLFSLFPNPPTNNFTLQTNHRGTLTITNQLGQLIFKTKIEKEKTQISTAGFAPGIYFVQLVTDKNISVQKIIVQ